jgi:hypothetical protein
MGGACTPHTELFEVHAEDGFEGTGAECARKAKRSGKGAGCRPTHIILGDDVTTQREQKKEEVAYGRFHQEV